MLFGQAIVILSAWPSIDGWNRMVDNKAARQGIDKDA
jgi:hypothetical protein